MTFQASHGLAFLKCTAFLLSIFPAAIPSPSRCVHTSNDARARLAPSFAGRPIHEAFLAPVEGQGPPGPCVACRLTDGPRGARLDQAAMVPGRVYYSVLSTEDGICPTTV